MTTKEFGIALDPAEKDGTITIYGEDDTSIFKLTMNWRAAAAVLVSLHGTIHAAASQAGVSFDEVHDHMDKLYNDLLAELEESDGDEG